MRRVEAVRYVGPKLSGGGQQTASRPHVLTGDDGNNYVVKFQRDCAVDRTLVNEQVVGAIAETLTVPFPGIAHVRISADLVANSPELAALNLVAGLYLGSRELPLAFDLNRVAVQDVVQKIVNRDEAAGAIAMDTYVWNTDRNNAGNLLVEPTQEAHKYRFYVIDHGHCFGGPNWTELQLGVQAPQAYNIPTHAVLRSLADAAANGEYWLAQIEALPELELDQIVDDVPAEWNFQAGSNRVLKEYLRERKAYTRRDAIAGGLR
ncbi:MAG TPA: HipA family kinase [Candidatus Sulfotelmatobacter sp.]|nr:HipA family kinase [Candidatus Sulfotelmatobacter sp.]